MLGNEARAVFIMDLRASERILFIYPSSYPFIHFGAMNDLRRFLFLKRKSRVETEELKRQQTNRTQVGRRTNALHRGKCISV